jgi:hypothetical protein
VRATLINLALILETALVVWTGVFYRCSVANVGPDTPFTDLIPYRKNFAVVVAPWKAASAIIPACLIVLDIAKRIRRKNLK